MRLYTAIDFIQTPDFKAAMKLLKIDHKKISKAGEVKINFSEAGVTAIIDLKVTISKVETRDFLMSTEGERLLSMLDLIDRKMESLTITLSVEDFVRVSTVLFIDKPEN